MKVCKPLINIHGEKKLTTLKPSMKLQETEKLNM